MRGYEGVTPASYTQKIGVPLKCPRYLSVVSLTLVLVKLFLLLC